MCVCVCMFVCGDSNLLTVDSGLGMRLRFTTEYTVPVQNPDHQKIVTKFPTVRTSCSHIRAWNGTGMEQEWNRNETGMEWECLYGDIWW